MRIVTLIVFLGLSNIVFSQELTVKLDRAIKLLQKDKQFAHCILSLCVVDSKTGKLIYAMNEHLGLAPASCQKVVTSASGFELLGKDFTYLTQFGYNGKITGNTLDGNLCIIGNGDPTFGSWRWSQTGAVFVIQKIREELKKLNLQSAVNFNIDNTKWGTQTLPGGWPWEDVGQYYGAGCNSFTWHENQYEIVLKPGNNLGDSVSVVSANPFSMKVINEVTTAAKGSGDQVYVYNAPYSTVSFLRGTAPLGMDTLKVAASSVDGVLLFQNEVLTALRKSGLSVRDVTAGISGFPMAGGGDGIIEKNICNFSSPTFDSMNYWFIKKSINLYGEAFVKTIAYKIAKLGTTDTGVNIIREFWSNNGIEKSALKIIDGSGLSPANRLTTNALVTILQYAKKQPWFSSFYYALPEMNGIKMKDGYIGGVRSYAGYVKSATGAEYSFAFIVNNFDGAPSAAREKMWKVLDLLK